MSLLICLYPQGTLELVFWCAIETLVREFPICATCMGLGPEPDRPHSLVYGGSAEDNGVDFVEREGKLIQGTT